MNMLILELTKHGSGTMNLWLSYFLIYHLKIYIAPNIFSIISFFIINGCITLV